MIGLKIKGRDECPFCWDTKEVVVCGWCREGVPHASCDDSWIEPCEHCEDEADGKVERT